MIKKNIQILGYGPSPLNIFLDIVVLLTDTYTYCLYRHNGDGSF